MDRKEGRSIWVSKINEKKKMALQIYSVQVYLNIPKKKTHMAVKKQIITSLNSFLT